MTNSVSLLLECAPTNCGFFLLKIIQHPGWWFWAFLLRCESWFWADTWCQYWIFTTGWLWLVLIAFSLLAQKTQIHLEERTPNSSCINNKEFAQATLSQASRITHRPLCQRLIKMATQQLYYNYPSSHFQKHERFKASKWKDTALHTLPTSQIQTRCPWRAQRNIVRHHSRALTLTNALLFGSLASLHGSCSKTQIFCCPSSLINTKQYKIKYVFIQQMHKRFFFKCLFSDLSHAI